MTIVQSTSYFLYKFLCAYILHFTPQITGVVLEPSKDPDRKYDT